MSQPSASASLRQRSHGAMRPGIGSTASQTATAVSVDQDDEEQRGAEVQVTERRDHHDAHRLRAHVDEAAQVPVDHHAGGVGAAADPAHALGSDSAGAHQPEAVEEDDEPEAERGRQPEDRQHGEPEHVGGRCAGPLRGGVDLDALGELEVKGPLARDDDQHRQVERPRRRIDGQQPHRRERLVEEAQPGERLARGPSVTRTHDATVAHGGRARQPDRAPDVVGSVRITRPGDVLRG